MSNNEGSLADKIAKRITGVIISVVTSPFAFLLWLSAAVIATGLGFGYINTLFSTNRLPTFGIQAQSAIYAAGVIYLLHGKV